MNHRFALSTALLSLAATALPLSDAHACGGCFIPVIESTVVTGHRMAFATSPTQTVLWDQITYAGAPSEFAWLLPVRPGAVIEASTDAWFEALEAGTQAQIVRPSVVCEQVETPGGCSSRQFDGANFGEAFVPPVTVVHQGTVGAYETVTLSTNTPGALNTWLTEHGFNVEAGIQPTIGAYVQEGFGFIALRLQPGKGIRDMKPVRIVTPGAGLTLPLRMVAAGTGQNVAITLYAISEGKLEIDGYHNTEVPGQALTWDFADSSSNYATFRRDLLATNNGKTWITAFAHDGGLLSSLPDFPGSFNEPSTIASLYVNQGISNEETTESACLEALFSAAEVNSMVVDPCPAGVASDDPSCGTVAAGQIDARTLACGALDDVAVALTGMHPRDVWVTRLEADLPRSALAGDLVLRPAASQTAVSNYLTPGIFANVEGQCPANVAPLSMIAKGYGKAESGHRTAALGYALMALVAASAIARRARRK